MIDLKALKNENETETIDLTGNVNVSFLFMVIAPLL